MRDTKSIEADAQRALFALTPLASDESAIAAMKELQGDPEEDHMDADRILLAYLVGLGKPEVARAWLEAKERCSFWYA